MIPRQLCSCGRSIIEYCDHTTNEKCETLTYTSTKYIYINSQYIYITIIYPFQFNEHQWIYRMIIYSYLWFMRGLLNQQFVENRYQTFMRDFQGHRTITYDVDVIFLASPDWDVHFISFIFVLSKFKMLIFHATTQLATNTFI